MIWMFVFVYSIAGSIDFGAGYWSMKYIKHKRSKATNIANRYLSPSWEITNVFIVMVVVGLFNFFPGATYTLGTVLLLPASLILLLITIRSAFLVFSHSAAKYKNTLIMVSGISGLLVPALLILVLPITHGNFIEIVDGVERLKFARLLVSWSAYAFIAFAVSSTLFLSSLLLADYSHVSGQPEAYKIYRRDAVIGGPLNLLFAFLLILAIYREAGWLYTNIIKNWGWLLLSVLFFLVGYSALFWKSANKDLSIDGRPRFAVIGIVIQYLFASAAYGKAHLPYIVYPFVTIESGFTHPDTFRALFWSYMVSFAVLVPGFVYFWRIFMKDTRYLKQMGGGD
jgi:cytochrome d ubiquinol oxidase subunit II